MTRPQRDRIDAPDSSQGRPSAPRSRYSDPLQNEVGTPYFFSQSP